MPDEPLTTTNQVPVMPDPQKAVDEALAPVSSSAIPSSDSLSPANSPVEPSIKLDPSSTSEPSPSQTEEATVPMELLGSPTPEVSATPAVPEPPLSSPTDPVQSSSSPSTDDVPLAFAATTPSSSPTPLSEPPLSPPPPVAPLPPISQPEPPKKKRGGKIMAALVGLLLLIGGLGGGYWYYVNNFGEQTVIAEITDKSQCSGCHNGGYRVWRNGRCHVTGICGNTKNPDKNTQDPNAPPDETDAPASCTRETGQTCCGAGRVYCGGQLQKCVSTSALNAHGGNCNNYSAEVHNLYPDAVLYEDPNADGTCPGGKKLCACGGTSKYCVGTDGYCGDEPGLSNQTRMTGLCAITPNPLYTWRDPSCTDINNPACEVVNVNRTQTDADNQYAITDNIANWFNTQGLNVTGVRNVYYCENRFDNLITGCSELGDVNLSCFCGTVQIDYGNGFQSRTMRCGCGGNNNTTTNPSTPPSTPTLACTGLTKDKPTPAVGDVVKFTCAGSVTPAGATSLTYQFRLRKDGGAWQSLSATGDKASYTVTTAGAYEVQCKACGTINNASVCDPTWTGATTQ